MLGHAPTPSTNGIPSVQAKSATTTGSVPTQLKSNVEKSASSPSKQQSESNGSLSDQQLRILKNQILAFKMLSKNTPIPPALEQQLFRSQQSKQPPTVAQAVAAASQVLEDAPRKTKQSDAKDKEQLHMHKTYDDPHNYIKPSISYANHTVRANRTQVYPLMPTGVDVNRFRLDRELRIANLLTSRKLDLYESRAFSGVDGDRAREERERIAYNRITSRKSELEGLPANLAVWDTSKTDTPQEDDSLKRKALIEYKMLCLLPKQRALRQQVHRDLVKLG